MHKIDSEGATPDGKFQDRSSDVAGSGTRLTADWLNTVQDELVAIVEAGGQELDKTKKTQLRDAIIAIAEASGGGGVGSVDESTLDRNLIGGDLPLAIEKGGTGLTSAGEIQSSFGGLGVVRMGAVGGLTLTLSWGSVYLIDTTSAPITVRLPPRATSGRLRIIDTADKFGTNNLTILPATGEMIFGLAVNAGLVLNKTGESIDVYNVATFDTRYRYKRTSPEAVHGTFQPSISSGFGVISAIQYNERWGRYTKTGPKVDFSIYISTQSITKAADEWSTVYIEGLPFKHAGGIVQAATVGLSSGFLGVNPDHGNIVGFDIGWLELAHRTKTAPYESVNVLAKNLTDQITVAISGTYYIE